MEDDLLFHNKFVSNVDVQSTYNLQNNENITGFRKYIENKKNIVGLNDEDTDINEEYIMKSNPIVINKKTNKIDKERHVVEKRYIYNINSKTRETTQSIFIEKEVVTGEYVKVITDEEGNVIYDPIDIDELNEQYNLLNNVNSVVNPFYMIGVNMYFKQFSYKTPDDYQISLPLMHTNVKCIRLLSSIIPCTINNINKNNNHVMIDILFGSEQLVENEDLNIIFGTNIIKLIYGNYTIDEALTKVISKINDFYLNYINNTNNPKYDNIISSNTFSYLYDQVTSEITFNINQPPSSATEYINVFSPTIYENIIQFYDATLDITGNVVIDPNTGIPIFNDSICYLPVKDYTNFNTLASFIVFEMSRKIDPSFTLPLKYSLINIDSNYYISSIYPFALVNNTNIKDAILNTNQPVLLSSFNISPNPQLFDMGIGYIDFLANKQFNPAYVITISGSGQDVQFEIDFTIVDDTGATLIFNNQIVSLTLGVFDTYEKFLTNVAKAINKRAEVESNVGNLVLNNTDIVSLSIQPQYSDVNGNIIYRPYLLFTSNVITGTVKPSTMSDNIFDAFVGTAYRYNGGTKASYPDISSSQLNFIQLTPGSNFPYKVTAKTEICFTITSQQTQYKAYIPVQNYTSFEVLLNAIVDSMNNSYKLGYFAYESEIDTNDVRHYYIYSGKDYSLDVSDMNTISSVLFEPPETPAAQIVPTPLTGHSITSVNKRIEITGLDKFIQYDSRAYYYNNLYINVREKVPAIPYQNDPASSNIIHLIDITINQYNSINDFMDQLIIDINTVMNNHYGQNVLVFAYDNNTTTNKLTIYITPFDKYEFNIDGSLTQYLSSFLGISIESPTGYSTSYTTPYKYGNRLRFKMSFENNPDVSEDDQLWYMLGLRSNNSLQYVESWSNLFNHGGDSYYFSTSSFIDTFITTKETEINPSIIDYRPYRLPNMNKNNFIYLKLNNIENMYDPFIPNEKIFTKILLNENYGKYAYDTFVDNPFIYSTTESKLDKFNIKFIDKNGQNVDFGDIDHVLTIEITQFSDRLSVNDYNTRRGYNEHESYTESVKLSHGK
uniref:Uncharacterized protein n=1 Tax=viral metagenome TaxID=1070528 RepID=A0A6C0J4X4_9ZZZZ